MRERGIRVVTYIEDWLIAASSLLETVVHTCRAHRDSGFQNVENGIDLWCHRHCILGVSVT